MFRIFPFWNCFTLDVGGVGSDDPRCDEGDGDDEGDDDDEGDGDDGDGGNKDD